MLASFLYRNVRHSLTELSVLYEVMLKGSQPYQDGNDRQSRNKRCYTSSRSKANSVS